MRCDAMAYSCLEDRREVEQNVFAHFNNGQEVQLRWNSNASECNAIRVLYVHEQLLYMYMYSTVLCHGAHNLLSTVDVNSNSENHSRNKCSISVIRV